MASLSALNLTETCSSFVEDTASVADFRNLSEAARWLDCSIGVVNAAGRDAFLFTIVGT
jgi:hypothetical protein